jgi:predicted amidohydrolase YtcJ
MSGRTSDFPGEERARRMFAHRSLIDAGLRPPASSDYTASPPGAYASFEEHDKGSIEAAVSRVAPIAASATASIRTTGAWRAHGRTRPTDAGENGSRHLRTALLDTRVDRRLICAPL